MEFDFSSIYRTVFMALPCNHLEYNLAASFQTILPGSILFTFMHITLGSFTPH